LKKSQPPPIENRHNQLGRTVLIANIQVEELIFLSIDHLCISKGLAVLVNKIITTLASY